MQVKKAMETNDRWLLCGGLCFLWLCIKATPIYLAEQIRQGLFQQHITLAYAAYALSAAAIICALWLPTRESRLPRMRLALSAVMGAIGLGLLALPNPTLPIAFVAVVFLGLFIGTYLYCCVSDLTGEVPTHAILLVCLSSLLAEGIRFVFSFGMGDFVRIAYPLLAAACLMPQAQTEPDSSMSELASAKSLPWRMMSASILLLALWSLALGVMPQAQTSTFGESDLPWSYGFSFIMVAAITVYFFRYRNEGRLEDRRLLYPFAAIVVLYLFTLTAMEMLPSSEFSLFKRMFIALAQCLDLYVFILIVNGVAARHLSFKAPLALYAVFFNAGIWVVVSNTLQQWDLAAELGNSERVVLALSFVTALITIVFLLRSASGHHSSRRSGLDRAQINLCDLVAERQGLSSREAEVLKLLYRGYSARRIANELFVSENTVRSHTNNVYRKLDVHSKQELMDVVDSFR